MGAIVGIDLGTTNSCVAVVRDGRPRVIEDERGYNILPSCIAMKSRGRFVVGHGAKALILTNPKDTLYAIKRLIGRKASSPEVAEVLRHVSYDVVQGERGEVLLRLGDLEITPVEASSIILKAVKEIAEKALGEPVTDAVITVPANFKHSQRKATMEAGENAGLNVLRLLNEPTAAALAYGFKKDYEKKIAIFDLGGGTFDISVLEVGDGVYEILGTAGNTFLGGEDFDYRIVNWLSDHFRGQTGVDPRNDKEALQRLKDAAERAKCELSFVDRTPILVPRLHGEHNLEVELTRDQLESMVQDLINETIKITDSALRAAKVSIEDLDEIILVGGMTRMPKIQETIRIFFGMNPCKGVHPEEVVAIGAAVHGYSLESETHSTLLLDVTPFSLGIDMAGGFFKPVIDRNATVPCSESRTFTTVRDNQSEVKVVARQGESKLAQDNEFLGEFVLGDIRPAPKMVPKIDVTFRIDSNGILHVTAVDRDTGEAQSIEIRDYVEQATGEEPKAIRLAQPDVEPSFAAAPTGGGARGASADEESGVFGRLKKMAGFGRPKKKEAPKKPSTPAPFDDDTAVAARQDESHAVAPRTEPLPLDGIAPRATAGTAPASAETIDVDELDLEELDAIAPRVPKPAGYDRFDPDEDIADDLRDALQASLAGIPAVPGPATNDPYAIAARPGPGTDTAALTVQGGHHRTRVPVESSSRDYETGLVEAPDEDVYDAFGVAPREAGGWDPLDLDESGLEELERFALVDRDDVEAPAPPRAPAPAPAPAERSSRKPAKLRISYKKASTFVREYQKNIPRGGTFIKTKKPLSKGRDCVLSLTVPGWDTPIEIRGEVVWSSKGIEVEAGQDEGMGIKYDPTDVEGLTAAQDALARLEGEA
jgi:molecular chaperone DnaK